ncbi:Pentatricopeptide repeat-containing protein At1g69290 [Linum grandiflorum]
MQPLVLVGQSKELRTLPPLGIITGTTGAALGTMLSRAAFSSFQRRRFSSEAASTLYSFLQPSIFAVKRTPTPTTTVDDESPPGPKALTHDQVTQFESAVQKSILTNETDEAWKSFKSLTSNSASPSKLLTNSLITHLAATPNNKLNLKRAFASLVYFVEKDPTLLDFSTVRTVLDSMARANTAAPAFALIKCMFKNRYFMPFALWGDLLVEIVRKSGGGGFASFLKVFEEACRVAVDEKLEMMKPGLDACNLALEGCCKELESVRDAERVVETMSVLGVKPDEVSFGFLAYLYALKGNTVKIDELKGLRKEFGFVNSSLFYSSLIGGYVRSGNLEAVTGTILSCHDVHFSRETFCEVVTGFMKHGSVDDLARLIVEAQKLESASDVVERMIGFGVIDACVSLGFSDKAHSIVEKMIDQGSSVGLGVYVPILKAYCEEHRTAEATQLVMEISNSGMQLDADSYDSLIDAAMTSQDFQSAFTLFRDMREAIIIPELKGSYLTIMTGLMASHRPELMAAFLDEVVEDPRIEVKTHDWNSIIHAFCKAGRLEDARRTLRRMVFLQYEPNDQTYLSLINGYVTIEKYFSVLMLWNEVKRKISTEKERGVQFDHALVDAFLYALVKGGFFDAVMQVVEKSQEMKIFVDKWRYKQAFMEKHKKLKVPKLRRSNFRKMEALIAFKNWAGLNA